MEVVNIKNKIIKCDNDFGINLSNNYTVNELRLIANILYKMSSCISVENTLDNDNNSTGIYQENGDIEAEITIKELKDSLKVSKVSINRIKEICVNVLNTNFYFKNINGRLNLMPMFKNISIDENVLFFTLNDRFKPFIIEVNKNFMLWELSEFCLIKNKHSQSLYLLGRKYVNLNGGKIKFKLENVLQYFSMSLNTRIYDLDRMLKRSIDEIEEKTGLKVNYLKKKDGNKVKYIEFNFNYNKKLYLSNK